MADEESEEEGFNRKGFDVVRDLPAFLASVLDKTEYICQNDVDEGTAEAHDEVIDQSITLGQYKTRTADYGLRTGYKTRTESAVCEGKRSNTAQVTSGMPQGTVLGPLLFLLFVNDLPDNLKSSIRLFADDALLYSIVSSMENGDQLQEDLRKLEVWQGKWQMSSNAAKCRHLSLY
ncbi:hypothetical protein ACROYT_G004161 [Oculina patagonica]